MKLLIENRIFNPTLLENAQNTDTFLMKGIIQQADTPNQNGRVYPRSVLEPAVSTYVDKFVNSKQAFGELDHPQSHEVSLKNTSHIIKEIWWEGNNVMGTIEVLDTPTGNIVKNIVKAGHVVGVSSRADGTTESMDANGNPVGNVVDMNFICWDFVSNPSVSAATPQLNESVNGQNKIKSKIYFLEKSINIALRSE